MCGRKTAQSDETSDEIWFDLLLVRRAAAKWMKKWSREWFHLEMSFERLSVSTRRNIKMGQD
jgi:hypothetical protein